MQSPGVMVNDFAHTWNFPKLYAHALYKCMSIMHTVYTKRCPVQTLWKSALQLFQYSVICVYGVCGKAFSGYQDLPPLSNISMIMGTELRKDLVWVSIKTFADISNWPSEQTRQRRLEKVMASGQISGHTARLALHLHSGSGSREVWVGEGRVFGLERAPRPESGLTLWVTSPFLLGTEFFSNSGFVCLAMWSEIHNK